MHHRRIRIALYSLVVAWRVSVQRTGAFLASNTGIPSTTTRLFAANQKDDDDDDTLETLSEKLNSLLSTKSQTELLTTRLGQNVFCVNKTHVRESTITGIGRGLFASQDCPKGTLLTCYPGDALVDLDSHSDEEDDDDDKITWGSSGEFTLHQEYMLRAIRDHWGIVAMDGSDIHDSTYLGHYANDGAQQPLQEHKLSTYVIESSSKANAIHRPLQDCHMVTVATKDIQTGDEIFVTYGPEYWREQDGFVENNDSDSDSDDDHDEMEEFEFDNENENDENVFEDWEFDNDFYDDDEAEGIVSDILSSIEDDDQESPTRGKGFG